MQKEGQYETCSGEQSAYRVHHTHRSPKSHGQQVPRMKALLAQAGSVIVSMDAGNMFRIIQHIADGLSRV